MPSRCIQESTTWKADVTSEPDVAAAFAAASLAFGGVDLVVNNAGLSISKPLTETTLADWDLLRDVMARGSFLVSREAAKVLTAQGMGGDIVYIASKNAVFCANDLIALGVLQEMTRNRIRVPEDIAIVGYDDIDFAAAAAVPLTSVRQPRHQLGWTAAQLLLEEAADDSAHQHRQVIFELELVARQSTQGARRSLAPRSRTPPDQRCAFARGSSGYARAWTVEGK